MPAVRGGRRARPRRPSARGGRSRRGCTAPRPRPAGGSRAGRSCPRRRGGGSAGACRACRPGRGRSRARRAAAGAGRAAARRRCRAAGACRASSRRPCPRRGRGARRSSSTSSMGRAAPPPSSAAQQLEVAAAGQVRVEARRLDEAGDAVERRDAGLRVAAEQAHDARGGADQAEHHPQRRRLAGAVRAPGSRRRRPAATVRSTSSTATMLAVALDEPADLDRRGVAHGSEAARRGLGRRRGHRAEDRVGDAVALEAQHGAERGVELLAGGAVDRDVRQPEPAAVARAPLCAAARPAARPRRCRRGPGRRSRARPGAPPCR